VQYPSPAHHWQPITVEEISSYSKEDSYLLLIYRRPSPHVETFLCHFPSPSLLPEFQRNLDKFFSFARDLFDQYIIVDTISVLGMVRGLGTGSEVVKGVSGSRGRVDLRTFLNLLTYAGVLRGGGDCLLGDAAPAPLVEYEGVLGFIPHDAAVAIFAAAEKHARRVRNLNLRPGQIGASTADLGVDCESSCDGQGKDSI
jgi:hypothetical protein